MRLLLALLLSLLLAAPAPAQDLRARLADEIETTLHDQLALWYPRVVDSEHGGYLSDFTFDWQARGPQRKFIVTQSRHVWTTATLARLGPEAQRARYRAWAAHGFRFLRDVMWDRRHGGFFDLVTREGRPVPERAGLVKRAYGQAFAIYGLAAYYRASGDTAALGLAMRAFRWLDRHSHDPRRGGYYQFLQPDGTPMRHGLSREAAKDQNSSIHLLEAFTELYAAWPDPVVRARLEEMHHVVRDTIATAPGYLTLYFDEDWTPVSYRDSSEAVRHANEAYDHVSFGHDVETGFLLLEASEALGLRCDTTTLRVARTLVDHALRNGWDAETGGFHDRGYYLRPGDPIRILSNAKVWWAQAEGLNALLLMDHLFPDADARYFDRFVALWTYVKAHLLDAEHGDWYPEGIDRSPEARMAPKAQIWKGNYHTTRALLHTAERLRPACPRP